MRLKLLRRTNIINQFKLIYLPLLMGILAILTASITSYYIGKTLLLSQLEHDGINLARLTARKINSNIEATNIINTLIEDKIRIAGNAVNAQRNILSNNILNEIANVLAVDEINVYNSTGEIIYSNIESNVGWTSVKGHPVDNFRISDKFYYIEEIRMHTLTDSYYKYGYVRMDDGGFVQLGIEENDIKTLIQKFDYQKIVENLAKEDGIAYALITDTDLKAIADSDIEDIGIIYEDDEDYKKALGGENVSAEWYYEKIDETVLEVASPIVSNNQIIGIISIGLSMKNVYSSIYSISLVFSFITLIMVMLFLWVQNKNIVKPSNVLNKEIQQIDIDNNIGFRLSVNKNDIFWGLSQSINSILDKIDISFYKLKEQEAYIEHIASHDSLTGLSNRRIFMGMLEKALIDNQFGAVMLIDLDNFKEINDSLGHVYGDRVLQKIAELMLNIKDENMFISRFGGDEFLILIRDIDDASRIESYAKKIMKLFKDKIIVDNKDIYISCSMGVVIYSRDDVDSNQLIMNADLSMYYAKELGKNNYMMFNENMMEKLNEKIKVEQMLREVIMKKDLKLLYQPQISTSTGKVVSFEALLRIKNNDLSPAQFISVAEDTGMIVEIGRWVTEEAIKQVYKWQKQGLELKVIAINFSAKQLNDLDYIEFLKSKLTEYNVDAKYIEIEITESLILENEEKTIAFLDQLRALGVRIALDDFGTGYSSLSYLTFLPVDKIKLDKSLIDKYLEDKNIKVINGIISLAHSLDLEVVAEGVEEIKQYELLNIGKCNYIQGYLFSGPLEVDDAELIYNRDFLEEINK